MFTFIIILNHIILKYFIINPLKIIVILTIIIVRSSPIKMMPKAKLIKMGKKVIRKKRREMNKKNI